MDLVHLLQWNCRSIIPKKPDLFYLLNKYHPVIAAISETWLRPNACFKIAGYACLRDDRDDGYAGSCLLINKSYSFTQIHLPPHGRNIGAVAAKVMDINFLSMYIPHPNVNLLSELTSICSYIPHPIIILGDFNTHHTSWGSHHSDSFSPYLLDLFDSINVSVINSGSPTHRVYPNQNPMSAVDLTLCSPNLSSILHWRTLPYTLGSDHYPIVISLPKTVVPIPASEPLLKYKLQGVDWNTFAEEVDIRIRSLNPALIQDIETSYNNFTQILLECADTVFPKKKMGKKHLLSPPWWDSECSAAVKNRKKAEKCYNMSMTSENFLKYQKSAAMCKKLLKKKSLMVGNISVRILIQGLLPVKFGIVSKGSGAP